MLCLPKITKRSVITQNSDNICLPSLAENHQKERDGCGLSHLTKRSNRNKMQILTSKRNESNDEIWKRSKTLLQKRDPVETKRATRATCCPSWAWFWMILQALGGRVGPLLRAIGPPICPNLLFAVFYSNPLKLGLADKLGCFWHPKFRAIGPPAAQVPMSAYYIISV